MHLHPGRGQRQDEHGGAGEEQIAMRRYQVRSTIMTSNRPLEDGGKLLGDVPAATEILDRFLHNADVITITGKSYRLRNRSAKDPLALLRRTEMRYITRSDAWLVLK